MRYSGLLICLLLVSCTKQTEKTAPNSEWFPSFDFDAAAFQAAPRQFGPFTRWWLPGNDITNDELQREIQVLADNGFAGVEVQPLTMGLNPKAPKQQMDSIYSWDTPSFYTHLRAIMDQAEISGVVVDMNGGSGWPLGGSFFDPKESMRTLAISDTSIGAGKLFDGALPKPHNHDMKPAGMMAMMMQENPVDLNWAKVLSVTAAKVVKRTKNQAVLDAASLQDLTGQVKDGHLRWQAPESGDWEVVVSWSIPTGEKPSLIASPGTSYVIDHLDTAVVNKTYAYLLGNRTGLPKYYHHPLRAVFNDSYEFHTDRLISPDFLVKFKELNGYDIAPYLSAVFTKGYDHPSYLAAMYTGAKPPFVFNESENWRLIHDYDRTVNEVFKNNFIRTSDQWMEKRGLLHRTQAYGFPTDLIGTAGAADIPEAEQLFAEGSEGYLKLVTSGAHLNHRPVITQESFVSIFRADMTTPQKIKLWADKSLSCGINQLIYHGTPYKYNKGEFGKEGWNTWSSPYMQYVNFSTGMNESYPYWKDVRKINQYIARCQYALSSGKPSTEILIYMPFIDFTENQIALNPAEILYRGYFEGVEPDIKGFGVFDPPKTPIHEWYRKLWPLVNDLESKGITWEFVNDESLQKAKLSGGQLDIDGNRYQALVFANLPYADLKTLNHVADLTHEGLKLWLIGNPPDRQPSFLDFAQNDESVKQRMQELTTASSCQKFGEDDLSKVGEGIMQKVKFGSKYTFTRQINREMTDGSVLRFIWNKSAEWQELSMELDSSYHHCYWLDPESGRISFNSGQSVQYTFPPYGSVILLATKASSINERFLSPPVAFGNKAEEVLKLDDWNIKVGDLKMSHAKLFDWRTNPQFKFKSEKGVYSASFDLKGKDERVMYFVDLGKVYFTADVYVNGTAAGQRLFAPYQLDISKFIKNGPNQIEIHVTPTRLNEFVGEAVKGNPQYAQFKGKESTIMPAGLVGPVTIRKLHR